MMPSMSIGIDGIFQSLDRIVSIYQCNIIHEIGHSYCSDVWQELGVYATSLNLICSHLILSDVSNHKLKAMQRISMSQNRLL